MLHGGRLSDLVALVEVPRPWLDQNNVNHLDEMGGLSVRATGITVHDEATEAVVPFASLTAEPSVDRATRRIYASQAQPLRRKRRSLAVPCIAICRRCWRRSRRR